MTDADPNADLIEQTLTIDGEQYRVLRSWEQTATYVLLQGPLPLDQIIRPAAVIRRSLQLTP